MKNLFVIDYDSMKSQPAASLKELDDTCIKLSEYEDKIVAFYSKDSDHAMMQMVERLHLVNCETYLIAYGGAKIVRVDTLTCLTHKKLLRADIVPLYVFASDHKVYSALYYNDVLISDYVGSAFMKEEVKRQMMNVEEDFDFIEHCDISATKYVMFSNSVQKMEHIESEVIRLFANEYHITKREKTFEFIAKQASIQVSLHYLQALLDIPSKNVYHISEACPKQCDTSPIMLQSLASFQKMMKEQFL